MKNLSQAELSALKAKLIYMYLKNLYLSREISTLLLKYDLLKNVDHIAQKGVSKLFS